jgi:hypothetical protein
MPSARWRWPGRSRTFRRPPEAFAAGELTETRAREVAEAASECPSSEPDLLEAARSETVVALKERCRQVKAAAGDELQRYERIRRARYLRHWTDPGGALRLEARLTPDDGARVLAGWSPIENGSRWRLADPVAANPPRPMPPML